MPSIESNRKNFEAAKENGSIVPAVFSDVPKPIPVADYPVSPNPFLRTPLPAAHVQQPDMQRQWQTGATPQTRIVPLAAVSNPNIGAVAQSQAIQVVSTTASPLAKLVSLNVPSIFTPTSQTEDVNGLLAIFLANQPANTVWAGPSGTVLDEVDAAVGAAGNTSPLSISATPTQPADLALVFTATDANGSSAFTPSAPWALVINNSTNQRIYSQVTSGTSTVTASGATDASFPIWSSVLALITAKTGFTPSVVNSFVVTAGAFSGQTNAALGFTPSSGNTLLIAIMSSNLNALSGAAAVTAFSDSQGGIWQQIKQVNNASGSGTQVILYGSSSIAGGATTISFTLDRTLAAASVIALELSNTASPSLPPTFRALVGADLPFPQTVAKGGVFSLAATTSNFLTGLGTNGKLTAAQPAFTDISGNISTNQMNSGTGASARTVWKGSGAWATLPQYTVDLFTQGSNVGLTQIGAPGVTGLYRVSVHVIINAVATTSSTLPDCQISWTDGNNNTAQTIDFVSATPSANTLTTYYMGTAIVYITALTSAVQYQLGNVTSYATSGATNMTYNVHIRMEAL